MFIPTAEGYVSAVYPESITSGDPPKFAYVTNIRDHLGNLRMSLTRDNNRAVILQERHYYPFGLLHRGYNEEKHEIQYTEAEEDKIFTPQVVAGRYKYLYQEQERQEDLNLNWDSFKYRNYDYAIGRFMSVDPLAEKYPFWTPYAFSGNRLIDARELEGLEPHKIFKTPREAARNFGEQYNGLSIRANAEIGARLYINQTPEGETYYSYTTPVVGSSWFVDTKKADDFPENAQSIGDIHTHGSDNNSEGKNDDGSFKEKTGDNWPTNEDFTQAIKEWFENGKTQDVYMYVVTPNGKLLEFIVNSKTKNNDENVKTVSKDMPSDPNSQTRANNVSPNNSPEVLPKNVKEDDYPEITD